MLDTPFDTIAVVGAGVIGASWATYFAAHGYDVLVTDPAPGVEAIFERTIAGQWEALARVGVRPGASLDRVRFEPSLERAVANAGFVQENGPERMEVKHAIFEQLDRYTSPETLLVTSTSGLLVSEIQRACKHPQRVLLGHPFNPPHLIPLVEVLGGTQTSADAIARTMAFYRAIGKKPIHLKKEVPGHVANRLQNALWREAFYLVEEGIASVEDIDTAIESGPGLRWALCGPFVNLALSGGNGGIRHTLEHLGPAMEDVWHTLGATTLSPELTETIIAQTDAEFGAIGGREAAGKLRDERLIELVALKAHQPATKS